ncbi:hypothetical protein [Pedobacter punctiformis]|uniref:Uncharacterized protein n=1 Tax=Pedobacter punctiformis TaxID=3004097 RepID=A0ABT4LD33_9SPHI|nr:hypothetical protein [Pedobacter sp. HCMS5-2]MCZ4245820.1 hypothetical protein [Pedobacter sp. HCMS5-2]
MSDEEYNERPVWRNVLSICLILFALIRFGFYCSKMDDRNRTRNISQNVNDLAIDQIRNQVTQQRYNAATGIANGDINEVFYFGYHYLDTISESQKRFYHIVKLDKDSLVNIDFTTKFRALKGAYLQNTYDNTLRFAIKTPQNLSIFIHSLETKGTLDNNFKTLKENDHLSNLHDVIKLGKSYKLVSYSIKKKESTFRGIACLMGDEEYKLFIEFESNKLSQTELQRKALNYMSSNLVIK